MWLKIEPFKAEDTNVGSGNQPRDRWPGLEGNLARIIPLQPMDFDDAVHVTREHPLADGGLSKRNLINYRDFKTSKFRNFTVLRRPECSDSSQIPQVDVAKIPSVDLLRGGPIFSILPLGNSSIQPGK